MAIIKTNINDNERNYAKFDLALICEDRYKSLSDSDKVLYTILKNQESLSIKNAQNGNMRYVDSNGFIFIEISQVKLCKLLGKSEPTIRKSLNSLANVGLIERVSSGYQKCDKIYVGQTISTLTLGDYFKNISLEIEEENKKEDKKISIKASRIEDINKKASAMNTEAKENKPIKNICDYDINNTKSFDKSQADNQERKESEVRKLINKSCVNIKKEDIAKCEEEFADIDKLKKALDICEMENTNGIKALRRAYKYGKGKITTQSMCNGKTEKNGKLIDIIDVGDDYAQIVQDFKNGTNFSGYNPERVISHFKVEEILNKYKDKI